jgi:hypothetical protein
MKRFEVGAKNESDAVQWHFLFDIYQKSRKKKNLIT